MKAKPRFVLDTNLLVSAALIAESHSAQVFRKARVVGEVLLSLATSEELNEVLSREKFERYISRQDRERFFVALIREVKLVDVTQKVTVCRDPKDNKFLELALDGEATCIATRDPDLLTLNPFRGIPILNVNEFLGRY
jgi:putative PIN family toxin of toxin-antitoxin system